MKRLVWLYPRRWRDRYGREMVELLATSQHPWRDGMNLAVYAALAWSEVPMFKVISLLVAAAALVMFGFTVGQLADGVQEIPQHWWSTISAAVAILALAAATVSLTRSRLTGEALRRRSGVG